MCVPSREQRTGGAVGRPRAGDVPFPHGFKFRRRRRHGVGTFPIDRASLVFLVLGRE
jgi:hypothetical protein